MLTHIAAMVIGFVVFVLSALKTVSLFRDSKDPKRAGMREVKLLNKRMEKLESAALRNIREIENVQRERMRVRLEAVGKMRKIKDMTDAEVAQHFKDLY